MSAAQDKASSGSLANLAGASELARSQARLAAVQALYQMDLAATDLVDVIAQFAAHRFGADAEDRTVADADLELFSELVRGTVERQRDIDPPLDAQLAAGWRLNRIDAIIRATLRCAMFELVAKPGVPARAVINEYVEVAKAFFAGDEPKVVNAVLDGVARKVRATEFAAPKSA
jgi:transcription antitermination protein NusB